MRIRSVVALLSLAAGVSAGVSAGVVGRGEDACLALKGELRNAALSLSEAEAATGQRLTVPAKSALACLKSIPLNKEIALNVTKNLRRYISFYSALPYFEYDEPPCPELELGPVKFNETLDKIEKRVSGGDYDSNYGWERDVHSLFASVRDGHTLFTPYCYSGTFLYTHDYPLAQIARKPDELPEIYVVKIGEPAAPLQIGDKVVKINGQNPTDYLLGQIKKFPVGAYSDPDARLNEMLVHQESGLWVQGDFAGPVLFDEDDITLEFHGGKSVKVEWKAQYEISGQEWDDAASFYTANCLRTEEEISKALSEDPDDSRESQRRLRRSNDGALQPRQTSGDSENIYPPGTFWLEGTGGYEIGYYFLNDETAVLMVQSFQPKAQQGVNEMKLFSTFISKAVDYAKEHNAKKFIVDFSGNGGGNVDLGSDMARLIFPSSKRIFFGSNMRWNPVLDEFLTQPSEETFDKSWYDLGQVRRADGTDFSSMRELVGPVRRDHDYFTRVAIPDEREVSEEGQFELEQEYLDESVPDPFKAEDVIIVTSSLCGSTCAIAAEALGQAGARTVSFGGRPRVGPIQSIGGIKGSQVMEFDVLLRDLRKYMPHYPGVPDFPDAIPLKTMSARINFKNSFRKGDGQYLPLEFLYTPAAFKLFYTEEMTQGLSALHQAALDVVDGKLKSMAGPSYTPKNGLDGSGWPGVQRDEHADGDGTFTFQSVGELIWKKMRHNH